MFVFVDIQLSEPEKLHTFCTLLAHVCNLSRPRFYYVFRFWFTLFIFTFCAFCAIIFIVHVFIDFQPFTLKLLHTFCTSAQFDIQFEIILFLRSTLKGLSRFCIWQIEKTWYPVFRGIMRWKTGMIRNSLFAGIGFGLILRVDFLKVECG